MKVRLLVTALSVLAASCFPQLETIDRDAEIACSADGDCPTGLVCVAGLELCRAPGTACIEADGSSYRSVADGNVCGPLGTEPGICVGGSCVPSICGDGIVDASQGETCDDGNDVDTDGCARCLDAICGDGFVRDLVEACDDGNTSSGDGCRADCKKVEICGDAELDAGEACDDGNLNPNDGCNACGLTQWSPALIVGYGVDGMQAQSPNVDVNGPRGVAAMRNGDVVIANMANHQLLQVHRSLGYYTVLAGTGASGSMGDGGPALFATMGWPIGVAIAPDDTVYFSDSVQHRIRRVDGKTGIITTYAGTTSGYSGNAGLAVLAQLNMPYGIALDNIGTLYVADQRNCAVREVTTGGYIYTAAGFPQTPLDANHPCPDYVAGTAGDGGAPSDALFRNVVDVAVGPDGLVYVADGGTTSSSTGYPAIGGRIRVFDLVTDTISSVAGNDSLGDSPDGTVALGAPIYSPNCVFVSEANEVHFCSQNKVRKIDAATGQLVTVFGGGTGGDGSLAPDVSYGATSAAFDPDGGMLVTDATNGTQNRIRYVDPVTNRVSTLMEKRRHPIPATSSSFSLDGYELRGAAFGPDGDLYFTVPDVDAVVRLDQSTDLAHIVAGGVTRAEFSAGDGFAATDAFINNPYDVAFTPAGDLIIADTYNNKLRKVDHTTGIITTIAGTTSYCSPSTAACGDGGPATQATLRGPSALAVASNGSIYFLDSLTYRVRMIDAAGNISTVAGNGVSCTTPTGACGDGGAATAAQLAVQGSYNHDIALDAAGNLYIVQKELFRVRRVRASDGVIETVAGTGVQRALWAAGGDGGAASAATFYWPTTIGFDTDGSLLIADRRIRRVAAPVGPTSKITTLFGDDGSTPSGDNGDATTASFGTSRAITMDASGNYIIASGPRMRKIDRTTKIIRTIAGDIDGPGCGPTWMSRLSAPNAIIGIATDRWAIADGYSGRLRMWDATDDRLYTIAGYPNGLTEAADVTHQARYKELFGNVAGVAFDPQSASLFVADASRATIWRIQTDSATPTTDWTYERYAGDGAAAAGHLDGPKLAARFEAPQGLAFDAVRGDLFVADPGSHVIRKIDGLTGEVTTLAGEPYAAGFFGDGLTAADALFDSPSAIVVSTDGSLYVADTGNNRVRRIAPDPYNELSDQSIVTTVIGDGYAARSGEGATASLLGIAAPRGLAVDRYNNLYVTSTSSVRVIAPGPDGVVTGADSVRMIFGEPPRSRFPDFLSECLTGVVVRPNNTSVYALDSCRGFMIEISNGAP